MSDRELKWLIAWVSFCTGMFMNMLLTIYAMT